MTPIRRPRFGLTILELVVATCALAIIAGVLIIPAMNGCCGPRSGAKLLKDAMQVEQIHQAMLIYARESDGTFPLPGRIDRLPDTQIGLDMPGRGAEDVSLNHSAPLYSAMIAQNYFTPDLVIGPTEPSSNIVVMDDYDYTAYDPANDSYWDNTFSADLRTVSHTSYAHLAICGERKKKLWRDQMGSIVPMFSNRGPRNGATTGKQYTDSVTLSLHGPDDEWVGNVVFADNHVETLNTLKPAHLQPKNSIRAFNLFRMDGGALGISIASTEDDVTRVWDPIQ